MTMLDVRQSVSIFCEEADDCYLAVHETERYVRSMAGLVMIHVLIIAPTS